MSTDDNETLASIHRAIARLDPFHRELLWMAAAEQRSYDDIASHFGISTASVERQLARALFRVGRAIDREHHPRAWLCFSRRRR